VPTRASAGKTARAFVGVDHDATAIEFAHAALGTDVVAVRQDLEKDRDHATRDATARFVWDGAAPMATWLCENATTRVRGKRVVELGAGPGLPGIVAAKLGAREVVLTDLASELELLRANAALNGLEVRDDDDDDDGDDGDDGGGGGGGRVRVRACPWGDADAARALGTFDLVVCSDVLYGHREETARALARTMRRLCAFGGERGGGGGGGGEAGEGERGAAVVSYFAREKLFADVPFFETCDELFLDATQHTVGGVAEENEDLWFLEYRPK
jgi:predicted nicotinamide N-methyase